MIFSVFYFQKNSGMFYWNKLTFMLLRNRENLGSMIPIKMKWKHLLEHYFLWLYPGYLILITSFLAIGFLLFPQYKMFLPQTDSGNCGRIFIWLTIQDNLLLLMRAMISCTNYGQWSMSWEKNSNKLTNIGQHICVDEHMVKGKGKNPFKQYLPMKPIKKSTKTWELVCSCCGYLCDFQVCTGKSGRNSQRGLAHRVIADPVMLLRDKDTVVYIDNFFTSIPHCKGWRSHQSMLWGQ